MATIRLFVTKATELSNDREKYLHDFRKDGRLVSEPAIGDQVIDVLDVSKVDDTLIVRNRFEATPTGRRVDISSTWSWGDQYEEGAEYDLAGVCLSALFYDADQYSLLPAIEEHGPLFPLVYSLRACPEAETGESQRFVFQQPAVLGQGHD